MNERQKELLQILLQELEGPFLVNALAEKLGCSEKTIRNDLKTITDYLSENSTALLVRKPGSGVYIETEEEERRRLSSLFFHVETVSEQERSMEIAYTLLMAKEAVTIQSMADRYYVSRTQIKRDIDCINEWLSSFGLSIESRQRVGFILEGSELKKRSALAHLPQLLGTGDLGEHSITNLFPDYEVKAVKKALSALDESFTDDTLDRLLVHILIMMRRTKLKCPIQVTEQEREAVLERTEFEQANKLLSEIGPLFLLRFPDDEVIYFAWHLMSGKRRRLSEENSLATASVMLELVSKMSSLTGVNFRQDETLQEGLSVHLQSVIHRVSYGLTMTNPLLTEIKRMYPHLFGLIILALEEIRESFGLMIPEEESAYLLLHFQAALERRQRIGDEKKKTIVVCHMGIGMSQLLRTRLEQHINHLDVVDCIAKANLADYLLSEKVDLIISTVEVEAEIPVVVVSPLFDEQDKEKVREVVKEINEEGALPSGSSALLHFINEPSIFLGVKLDHRYEVIEKLANALYNQGFVEKEYAHSALLRERMSGTAIGSGIAIPHGNPNDIKRSGIAVAVLDKPIDWENEWVSVVFLMAVSGEKDGVMKQLFQELSLISEKPFLVKQLAESVDQSSFLKRLHK
ncbi:BglG family transcription antiterminator [Domibacillus enclensis]|uniref:Activator of the mannose operon, transcriptional antiterminator n=1 Tax=Domibacillus enclensis TaxID=1017273 RepID=A0A1N6RRK2_9BACI|nr:BglG family transcription antiterminator [Domibacillus enclensis]OXS79125.1 hypothetical protein B1B05_04940 [Domibacillus enclensis]SIQ31431.1 activator of the mannose operon, transcriptional antiterminator [Domibacillus enclensis]